MKFAVRAEVSALDGISDPEAATIERALSLLGFESVSEMKAGRLFSFVVEADDTEKATAIADDLCHKLLANPVIQRADVTVSASS